MPQSTPVLRDLVLIGGGHSHVAVLRHFAMQPEPGLRLTLISREVYAPYSGMLPGYVAGHYDHDQTHIDLCRLAAFAGARFFHDEVVGIDREQQLVLCRERPPVSYDLLSINTGSTPGMPAHLRDMAGFTAIKPVAGFDDRWQQILQRVGQGTPALHIAVAGGGAGGVEILLAMQYRLQQQAQATGSDTVLRFSLFTLDDDILPTHSARVRQLFRGQLAQRQVTLYTNSEITAVDAQRLQTADGTWHAVDEVIWATRASGPAWLRDSELALDEAGFIRVNDQLQSITDPRIFAAGDVASQQGYRREKAGVFAVRQGKPLAHNLRAALLGKRLRRYRPQRRWLALISTGDRFAVASRGAFSCSGAWVWRWKDQIDRRFMQRFNALPESMPIDPHRPLRLPLAPPESAQLEASRAMRCGGCAAKVGADALQQALADIPAQQGPDVIVGLQHPDDAAVVRIPAGQALVHSVDFFRDFLHDPWLLGQVAANHALNDIFAMGARPHTASAIATVPPGLDSKVRDNLQQMMLGAVSVLNAADCSLVGGHSSEGSELALGFAVNGLIEADGAGLRKGGMREGDLLILSKALGTGILFAAHARWQARGHWIEQATAGMRGSNAEVARCLHHHGATACTDVTGFGLLGHLTEMCRASGLAAEIELDALPALPGALDCARRGLLSSLHAQNLRQSAALAEAQRWQAHPHYPLLFDPQTAGPLLASVPATQAVACLDALKALGHLDASVIGKVARTEGQQHPVFIKTTQKNRGHQQVAAATVAR